MELPGFISAGQYLPLFSSARSLSYLYVKSTVLIGGCFLRIVEFL